MDLGSGCNQSILVLGPNGTVAGKRQLWVQVMDIVKMLVQQWDREIQTVGAQDTASDIRHFVDIVLGVELVVTIGAMGHIGKQPC